MTTPTVQASWTKLRQHTSARIGLAQQGAGIGTSDMLAFQQAHALARDAVHAALDTNAIELALKSRSLPTFRLHSAARDRRTYLVRPDLGRKIDPSHALPEGDGCDLAIVIADGLSATAVQRHAVALLDFVIPALAKLSWRIGPIAIVEQARVAIGDEIGAHMKAEMAMVLIGERPGLSSPDSLGAYLTWSPKLGRTDAERNCVSNIRPEGLALSDAAARIVYLLTEGRRRGLTGVMLKDDSSTPLLA